MGSAVTQFQILSNAPDDTAAFYSKLFGWRIAAKNPLGYRQIDTGTNEGIGGGIWPAPPQAQSFVQLFISVNDVKGMLEQAVALGAKVLIPHSTLPEGDEMAVLHDPHGMSFALWRSRR